MVLARNITQPFSGGCGRWPWGPYPDAVIKNVAETYSVENSPAELFAR